MPLKTPVTYRGLNLACTQINPHYFCTVQMEVSAMLFVLPTYLSTAPRKQSPRPASAAIALSHPLTPDERKTVADGWNALPVQSVSCFLLGFTHQLNIPLSELQPYLRRALAKIPSLQVTVPIGAPTRKFSLELGQGSSALVQAIEQALATYLAKRVLYEVERSLLAGIMLELSSTVAIQSASDLLAAVESGDLELSLSRSGAGELTRTG